MQVLPPYFWHQVAQVILPDGHAAEAAAGAMINRMQAKKALLFITSSGSKMP